MNPQEKEKPYTGFWMQLGCILSALAILGILFIIGYFIFMMIQKG